MSRLSRKCGILNISQPCRPPPPVTAIALLFFNSQNASVITGSVTTRVYYTFFLFFSPNCLNLIICLNGYEYWLLLTIEYPPRHKRVWAQALVSAHNLYKRVGLWFDIHKKMGRRNDEENGKHTEGKQAFVRNAICERQNHHYSRRGGGRVLSKFCETSTLYQIYAKVSTYFSVPHKQTRGCDFALHVT
jgi:hypothetical protein